MRCLFKAQEGGDGRNALEVLAAGVAGDAGQTVVRSVVAGAVDRGEETREVRAVVAAVRRNAGAAQAVRSVLWCTKDEKNRCHESMKWKLIEQRCT